VPVYILREGASNIFKIGRTSGSVDGVIKRLKTGNSQPLTVFDLVETDRESACEAFFHRRLRSKRVVRGGGWEFFEVEAEEMTRAVEQFRRMFEELEVADKAISELAKQQCTNDLLEPSSADQELLRRLVTLKEEQEYLQFECQLIESRLKRRIGAALGLRGIATWKTQVTRRYNEMLFRDSDPDRYNRLLEQFYCLDTAAWKRERPDEYREIQTTYYSPSIARAFRLQKMD
jgi:hypothetical protein